MASVRETVTTRAGSLPLSLVLARRAIDGIDDALLALLAGRGRLAGVAARCKQRAGLDASDPSREAAVHARGQRLGARMGLRGDTARAVLEVAIGDGRARGPRMNAAADGPARCRRDAG